MREMLREALEDEATRVEAAAAAAPASSACKQGGIDLVVTDVKMPDIDGLDMLREIKARRRPSPHVIIITAFGSIETAIRAVKLGAYDYITKPFEIEELMLVGREGARRARAALARWRGCATRSQRSYRFEQHHRQVGRRCRRCSR